MAALQVLLEENLIAGVAGKSEMFKKLLIHPAIRSNRSFGLWMALEFDSFECCKKIIDHCIQKGMVSDWFLFASNRMRISPPLVISEHQIKQAAAIILEACSLLTL